MIKKSKSLLSVLLVMSMLTPMVTVYAKDKNVNNININDKKIIKPAKKGNKKKINGEGVINVVENKNVKNIIFLIGDGMNASQVTLARWYKGNKLALDEMVSGMITNFNSNSIITDSAPAVTALATGYKTDSGFISVYPDSKNVPYKEEIDKEKQSKPLATVLEAAKLLGKSTGIIATSNIQHATPAGFTSHNFNRNNYCDIAEQQVYENIDVVLGGGKQYLVTGTDERNPDNTAYGRKDGDDLLKTIKELGYTYVEDRASMLAAKGNKLWGMFADDAMSYDIDRDVTKEPSLKEMTSKAIDVLSKNKNGFFLMVEGSKIDWAAHANDPIGSVTDTVAFDEAVKTALDFAKKDKNTLVIALTDHGTGGMTIGNANTATGNAKYNIKKYDELQLDSLLAPLKKATVTLEGVGKLFNSDKSNIKEVIKQQFGIDDLTNEELELIRKTEFGKIQSVLALIVNLRTVIGWTTIGHTGEDVVLYSYGPQKLTGLIDNTDVAKNIAKAMGVDMDEVNEELYVNVKEGIASIDNAEAELDTTDAANPVLIIRKGNIEAKLPISTNKLIINDKVKYLEGLNLITKSGDVYVSLEAFDIISKMK